MKTSSIFKLSLLGWSTIAHAEKQVVYVMTNNVTENEIVGYEANEDGTLNFLGAYSTGGKGAILDAGEGLDPLISAYSLDRTAGGRFVMAVNAGSNTVSVLKTAVNGSLTLVDQEPTMGTGPVSVAAFERFVYVANVDADGQFGGPPDQMGNLYGYRMTDTGELCPMKEENALRVLPTRPSAIRFSPDGRYLVVTSLNAGSSALPTAGMIGHGGDEVIVYKVDPMDGSLSSMPVSVAASTLPNNTDDRNLPTAIGFDVVEKDGSQFVVVSEAREFRPDGSPPVFDDLQAGSVSSWELSAETGALKVVSLDVPAVSDENVEQRTVCWLRFNVEKTGFWVANALESTLSSYVFNADGSIALSKGIAAAGTGPSVDDPIGTTDGFVDFWVSENGKFLYQLNGLAGSVGVYRVSDDMLALESVEESLVGNLPEQNTQGLVALTVSDDPGTMDIETCDDFDSSPSMTPMSAAKKYFSTGILCVVVAASTTASLALFNV